MRAAGEEELRSAREGEVRFGREIEVRSVRAVGEEEVRVDVRVACEMRAGEKEVRVYVRAACEIRSGEEEVRIDVRVTDEMRAGEEEVGVDVRVAEKSEGWHVGPNEGVNSGSMTSICGSSPTSMSPIAGIQCVAAIAGEGGILTVSGTTTTLFLFFGCGDSLLTPCTISRCLFISKCLDSGHVNFPHVPHLIRGPWLSLSWRLTAAKLPYPFLHTLQK